MKNFKLAFLILTLFLASTTSFAQSALESQVQLKTPYSMSKSASENSLSKQSGICNDPIINGYMGAMSNMLNNNTTSPYQVQELEKQRLDYTKQNVNY